MPAEPLEPGPPRLQELDRREPGRHLDQRELGRVQAAAGAADVDHAQAAAGPRVRDGGGRTAPPGVGLHEVLPTADPDRAAQHQGGADGVGADVALGPGRPAHEPEVVGHPLDPGRAAPPQHAPLVVADHHQLPGVDHGLQRAHQAGHHPGERARGPAALDLGLGQRRDLGSPGRVQAAQGHASPGGGDLGAGRLGAGGGPGPGQDGLAGAAYGEVLVVHAAALLADVGRRAATQCNPLQPCRDPATRVCAPSQRR